METNKENASCVLCGKPHEPENYDPCRIREIMEEKHVCFNCAFWFEQKEHDDAGERKFAVINGKHFVLCPHTDITWPRGLGGARIKFRFNDGHEEICDNVWSQGPIPEHLRHLFPDNAVTVKEPGFTTLS